MQHDLLLLNLWSRGHCNWCKRCGVC